MAKDRSLVRASDIGMWAFCRRAWWLANIQHVPHRNPVVLQQGETVHLAHGRQVARAAQLSRIGLLLFAIGLLLAGVLLLWLWIG